MQTAEGSLNDSEAVTRGIRIAVGGGHGGAGAGARTEQ